MSVGEIKECRLCHYEGLVPIISLGSQYISNFVDSEAQNGTPVPLDLILCTNCKLLQLKHNAPDNEMWGEQYWYKSAINRLIRDDLKDIVDNSEKLVNINRGELAIDIGCNDGTLLSFYDKEGVELVGFEPSGNVAREAAGKGFNVINDFFNAESFRRKFGERKAKIITAISMFYDLDDPNKFLEDVISVLDDDGLFVIQQNYLLTMLEKNAFDNICHEHRVYHSLYTLSNLLGRHGLEVFDIKLRDINGGSIRTYVRKKNSKNLTPFRGASTRIKQLENREKEMGLDTDKPYHDFAYRISAIKKELLNFIENEKKNGKTFGICGASTRGNTTLQYFELGPQQVIAAAEANPDKWGKKTVGTMIPIIPIEEMKKINPDYQIVLIWHLFDGLMDKEKDYLKNSGKFILPLPEFKIIEYSKEFERLMVKSFYN